MRGRILLICMVIVVLVVIAILCLLLPLNKTDEFSKTQSLEMEFYISLLHELKDNDCVYIEDLVPANWDTMKVFTAYATRDDKIESVGYEYAHDLQDITHEDVLSLVFLLDEKVVYYVDVLVPRMFDVERINASEVELSLAKGLSERVNVEQVEVLENWFYKTEITETHRQSLPYFDVIDTGIGQIALVLKTKD